MHPWIARQLIYYPILSLRGESLRRCLTAVRAFNRLSADQMADDQWRRLQKLLGYVYRQSPYYRERFDQQGLTPEQIRTPEDYARIPLLAKADIRQNAAAMRSRERLRVSYRHTSGSTGVPLEFVKDRESLAYMDAVMHDCYSWHGIEIGDRQARIWGMPFGVKKRIYTQIKDCLLNHRRLVSFDLDQESSRKFYVTLLRFHPDYLYGLPNAICDFARNLRESNLNPAALRLKAIITTGETPFPSHREFLHEVFECKTIDEYGCTESGIIAFECRAGRMHQMNHNLYLEIVDPETGQHTQPGQMGEVVLTDLFSHAMPLIRYRIGDLASSTPKQCSCGLASPLIGEISGRVSELIRLPGGRKVAAAILDYSMPIAVRRFRCVQRSLDWLQIYVESDGTLQTRDVAAITDKIRSFVGADVTIDIAIVDRIPAETSGKLRCFVSELNTRP